MNKDIKIYRFKEDLPLEFEIISLEELYKRSRSKLINPHRTAFYHIIWFNKGGSQHMVDFHPIRTKENMLLFLNKDIVQVFDNVHSAGGKVILFTDTFFCKSEADIRFLKETILFNDLFSISAIVLKETAVFETLVQLMEKETLSSSDQYQSHILKGYLQNFLLHAERERRNQDFTAIKKGPDLDYVLLFRDLLESRFKTDKQVSTYVSLLSVTEKRLNQALGKVLGKTAKEMIDERVMLEAKRLLAHSNESIKEIGYALGFEEPTNFIKYFRKHSGNTPVEFREKVSL